MLSVNDKMMAQEERLNVCLILMQSGDCNVSDKVLLGIKGFRLLRRYAKRSLVLNMKVKYWCGCRNLLLVVVLE